MCVVTLVETVRPSDEQVAQMWEQNPRGGGGVAWRDTHNGEAVVRWRKGLNKDQMLELNRTLPLPYILHFRQPSNDTSESLLAGHPFQIDADATTGFEGVTPGWVLFHNGHWNDWRKKMEAFALAAYGTPGFNGMPSGAWSDTRALAFTTHYLKFGFLEMVNEKVLCLGPGELDIEMFGGPWLSEKAPGSDQHFVVSNVSWRHQRVVGYKVDDRRQDSTRKLLNAADAVITGQVGGAAQQPPFPCTDGRTSEAAGKGRDQQKQVQEGHEGTVSGNGSRIETNAGGSTLGWGDGKARCCTGCGQSKSAGQFIHNQWFCWQCWASSPSKEHSTDTPSRLWVGVCETCKVGSSGMRVLLNDAWICMTCWETTGRPKTYYARDRAA